jgi:hypothetical protein
VVLVNHRNGIEIWIRDSSSNKIYGLVSRIIFRDLLRFIASTMYKRTLQFQRFIHSFHCFFRAFWYVLGGEKVFERGILGKLKVEN